MKTKSVFCKTLLCLASCAIASIMWTYEARADGTEQLGVPSIPIAPGSSVVVEGTGLDDAQPGDITIEIPAGTSISQVLLYWTGRQSAIPGAMDTIQVNGTDVTGPRIGGPTLSPYPSNTYRADITDLSATNSWVLAGQVNVVTVGGLDFAYQNDGAALVVILDDGTAANIQIMDGNDFVYLPLNLECSPVEFAVAPAPDPRVGTLTLIVTDVEVPRPAAVEITVDGDVTLLDNVLTDNEGNFLDIVNLDVPVPAGATNVTVRVLSIDDETDLVPASLAWVCATWVLPEQEPTGCTYTIGYWKNHPDDWPTDNLSIFSGDEAMDMLWSPTKGNAYIILAHQYIGAELNVVNGTSVPDEVLAAWYLAQDLLVEYMDDGVIPKKTDDRALAIYLAGVLDDYNNGLLGPCHCD